MSKKEKKYDQPTQSTNQPVDYHLPVLLRETIDALNIVPDGIYVDCTFGGGGHSKEILKRLGEHGKLFAFDQDADAAKNLPKDDRIMQYGEVTNSKTLARTIVHVRNATSLKSISNFKNALSAIVKGNPNKYFAQVFQALRIEVNDEFGALKEMLEQAPTSLKEKGRIAVITFHSLEDRIVKNFLKKGTFEETEQINPFAQTATEEPALRIITKKPITPGQKELKQNPRSRSAKLRVAEKA